MNSPEKKRIERGYLEEARRVSPIFPPGELVPHEEPDFLLPVDWGIIGIEVTELCREEPRAESRRLSKVPAKAKIRYSRLVADDPVNVTAAFAAGSEDVGLEDLTNSLVEFVHTRGQHNGTNVRRELPEGYCHIGILPALHDTGRWHGIRAFNKIAAPQALLESRIAKKSKRVSDYLLAASTLWLLVVNDQFLGPGEVYVRPEDLAQWAFDFAFDKVLLFSREPGGVGQVFELRRTLRPAA